MERNYDDHDDHDDHDDDDGGDDNLHQVYSTFIFWEWIMDNYEK